MSAGKLAIDEFVFLFSIMWGLTGGITFIIKTISGAVLEKYEYIDKYDSYINEQEKAKEGEKLEEFGEIVLDNISYKYKNQTEYALKNISFTLKKGEIVCILGHNGSGKTTLSKVLCGLLEDYQGTLSYNGRNMRDLDQKEYYKKIGIGFQDFTRYSLTLRENVAVGAVENLKNEGAIWDAVEKGNLKELLTELPEGMQTVLGKEYDSGGRELSGGQWQRIILSRAYMGNPDILLLDEPTAAIDPMEEMRLLNRFREIVAGKTAILISHRIGFARLADRIVMMENGKIVENGTHQELLEVKGSYWKMFQEQQKLYERS